MRHRRAPMLIVLAMLPVLAAATCDPAGILGGGVPTSQPWIIFDDEFNLASPQSTATIVKGGAISQGSSHFRQFFGNCPMSINLSGNWNGDIVRITGSGSGCGVSAQATFTGTANGTYGKATTMTGTYRITYSAGYGSDAGNWHASPAR